MDTQLISNAIEDGLTALSTGPACGCGRAYVCLPKMPAKDLKTISAICQSYGLRYLSEAYGAGKRCIYVGYDNATGRQLAQAKRIANNLKQVGIDACWDAVAD